MGFVFVATSFFLLAGRAQQWCRLAGSWLPGTAGVGCGLAVWVLRRHRFSSQYATLPTNDGGEEQKPVSATSGRTAGQTDRQTDRWTFGQTKQSVSRSVGRSAFPLASGLAIHKMAAQGLMNAPADSRPPLVMVRLAAKARTSLTGALEAVVRAGWGGRLVDPACRAPRRQAMASHRASRRRRFT